MQNTDLTRTSIPLIIAMAAIGPLLGVAVVYGVQSNRLDTVQKDISIMQARQAKYEELSERTARIETKIDFLVEASKHTKP